MDGFAIFVPQQPIRNKILKDILKPSIAFFHASPVTFVVNHPKIDKL